MAYGLIATPGGVDTHVHTITPELLAPALSAGVTTFVTAGFEEPPFAMERVLAGLEAWPINIGMQAGARATRRGAPRRAGRGRRGGVQDPRGQRRLPGPHRPRPALRRRARPDGQPPHRRAPRVAPSSRTRSRRSPAGRSTPTTSRERAAATSPTCWASSASRRSCARRPRRRSRSASTRPSSTSR